MQATKLSSHAAANIAENSIAKFRRSDKLEMELEAIRQFVICHHKSIRDFEVRYATAGWDEDRNDSSSDLRITFEVKHNGIWHCFTMQVFMEDDALEPIVDVLKTLLPEMYERHSDRSGRAVKDWRNS